MITGDNILWVCVDRKKHHHEKNKLTIHFYDEENLSRNLVWFYCLVSCAGHQYGGGETKRYAIDRSHNHGCIWLFFDETISLGLDG